MQQDACARFQQVFVDEGHDGNIVLRASGARHDGVIIINHLLKSANAHRAAAHIINSSSFISIPVKRLGIAACSCRWTFLGRLCLSQAFLILDVLFFEE